MTDTPDRQLIVVMPEVAPVVYDAETGEPVEPETEPEPEPEPETEELDFS